MRLCLVRLTVLSLLAVLLERERLLSLLCRPLVCWESEVGKAPFVSISSSIVAWLVVLNTMGTRQSPMMSDKMSRKMIAEVIAASRGKRMARPLQVVVSWVTTHIQKEGASHRIPWGTARPRRDADITLSSWPWPAPNNFQWSCRPISTLANRPDEPVSNDSSMGTLIWARFGFKGKKEGVGRAIA
jgi:hypothetical protein